LIRYLHGGLEPQMSCRGDLGGVVGVDRQQENVDVGAPVQVGGEE
jgi:hypothetical protein